MYRRPKFLEILLEIRREMALESEYDVDLFAETTRTGTRSARTDPYQVEQSDDRSSGNETVELSSYRRA